MHDLEMENGTIGFFFRKIAYSTTLILGNFSSGLFLEEIIVLEFN